MGSIGIFSPYQNKLSFSRSTCCLQLSLALGHPEASSQILDHKLIKYYNYKYENQLANWTNIRADRSASVVSPQKPSDSTQFCVYVDQKKGQV